MICIFVILGENLLKESVSDEDAACAAGVLCLFVHYFPCESIKVDGDL